ncbi:MAG TPA: DUF2252 family protein [Rhizomicrobium sp.]|jgi:hypothetical protein
MRKTDDIFAATRRYERWLKSQVQVVAPDLVFKHKAMRKSAFGFLRATYYRWAEIWPAVCLDIAAAPRIMGIGDLHIENFGTWRDAEGRLVWGVNDFDEAHTLPYTNDLVRLAASVLVASREGPLSIDGRAACAAILQSYAEAIAARHARPFVLEERNGALRELALGKRRSPKKFWKKIEDVARVSLPADVKTLLLPKGAASIRFIRRTAGTGALGVPRYAALGELCGAFVGREAKARLPTSSDGEAFLIRNAVRAADPFLHVERHWLVRRLAPHCERIELEDLALTDQIHEVLAAMGRETANIHSANATAVKAIRHDLARRKPQWLHDAASAMTQTVMADWKAWKKG